MTARTADNLGRAPLFSDAVAIQPGATALQVTPRAATSTATARVSPTIPALAAA